MPNMSSPKILRRTSKSKPLRVLVLGQSAVGKTALTVRFITRRFIGDYAAMEKKYNCKTEIDGTPVYLEILDTAGQREKCLVPEDYIRWADAYILMYSVADRCSFDECTRLKFLINHAKRPRRMSVATGSSQFLDGPVVLVGNKNDLEYDRMVSPEEGMARCRELGCSAFYDISVRESYDEVRQIFTDLHKHKRIHRSLVKSPTSESVKESPPEPRRLRRNATVSIPSAMSFDLSSEDSSGNSLTVSEVNDSDSHSKRKPSISRRFIKKVIPSMKTKDAPTNDTAKHDSELNPWTEITV